MELGSDPDRNALINRAEVRMNSGYFFRYVVNYCNFAWYFDFFLSLKVC
jgi:hypothetical protein